MKTGDRKSQMAENKTTLTEELQAKILAIQLRKLEQEEAIEADKLNQEIAVRKAASAEIKKKREAELYMQSMCTHRKENGNPRIVGVRDSNPANGILFQCLNCLKEFTSHDLPPDLAPPANTVGGVLIGFAG
jgi:hypothetical protein